MKNLHWTLAPLAIAVTGCGPGVDPGIGDWSGVSAVVDGGEVALPYDYDGTIYDFDMVIAETLTAQLTSTVTYGAEAYTYTYAGTSEIVSEGQHRITMPELQELPYTCTAVDDTMTCSLEEFQITFARADG